MFCQDLPEILHVRVSVAQRAGLSVHVVLDDGLNVTKLQDGHSVVDGGRDGAVLVFKAGVISQAGGVAALPLWKALEIAYDVAKRRAGWQDVPWPKLGQRCRGAGKREARWARRQDPCHQR